MQFMVRITVGKLFIIFFLLTIGSKESQVAGGKKKELVPTEPSKYFLECLPTFFQLLFSSLQNETMGQELRRADEVLKNGICIEESVNTAPNLVKCFANLFESLAMLSPEIGSEEKTKIKENITENVVCISDGVHNNMDIYQNVKQIITSFIDGLSSQHFESNITLDDKVTQYMGKKLLYNLAFHFQSSYESYPLPAGIQEQDKLKRRYLQNNAGGIVVAMQSTKKLLISLANVFNKIFKLSKPTKDYENTTKVCFSKTMDAISNQIDQNVGFDAMVEVYREIQLLNQKIQDPEPKEPKIKISRAIFDGVPVIITEPIKIRRSPRPAIVYIHGGGWIYRTPEKYLPQAVYLSKELGAVVVLVDYKRSPQYVFPEPVNDCLKVTKYLMAHTQNYTVNPLRIGIMGDSAGGNMAASVSLHLRDDKNTPVLKTQVLIYPCIQMFDLNLPSYQNNADMIGLGKDEMVNFYLLYANLSMSFKNSILNNKHICKDMGNSTYASYLDIKPIPKKLRKTYIKNNYTDCDPEVAAAVKKSMLNPYIFPLMATNLKSLPPALIINGEFDILRDEGLLYGHRLKKAGNSVKEYMIEGGYHGSFDMLNHLTIGQDVMDLIIKYLKNKL